MAKTKSFGSKITISATPSALEIKGLTDFSVSGSDQPTIDITSHDSTAREHVAGLKDYGSLELSGHFDAADAGQDELRTAVGSKKTFIITLPNGTTTITFDAIVGPCSESIPLDGTVTFTCSCKLTGDKTYSAT